MAEQESDQERTEAPSAKRLQEARERGDVPRSRELGTAAMLLAGSGALLVLGAGMGGRLAALFRHGLALTPERIFAENALTQALGEAWSAALWLLLPFAAVMLVAALVPTLALGGWVWSGQALTPNWSRIDPLAGLRRLLGAQGLAELGKALVKIGLVSGLAWALFDGLVAQVAALGQRDLQGAIAGSFALAGWVLLKLSAALVIVAAVDVPLQFWQHRRKLHMTRQELREEGKHTEGNPEVKGRVRQLQRELANRRMMAEVPKADVIVTNPEHFAVALRYDPRGTGAPRVVAKGTDLVAGQIRALASAHRVPLFAAPPLARALYYSTELNREIPAGLYLAVAQVLAYIYRLRTSAAAGAEPPVPPEDLDVPDEFLRRERWNGSC